MTKLAPEYYEGISKELFGKFGRASFFTSHQPSIGNYHEAVLREVVESLLSPRFAVRTGFSYVSTGCSSRQGDILIVDEHDPSPYFFRQGNFVVVNPRALVCVIEVKTRMNKREFKQSIQNLASFVDVARQADVSCVPKGLVFAISGAEFTPERLDDWYREISLPNEPDYYHNLVYSMSRGMIQYRTDVGEHCGHYLLRQTDDDPHEVRCLSIFLSEIRKYVELRARIQSNPYEYATVVELAWTRQYLLYGSGYNDPGGAGVDSDT